MNKITYTRDRVSSVEKDEGGNIAHTCTSTQRGSRINVCVVLVCLRSTCTRIHLIFIIEFGRCARARAVPRLSVCEIKYGGRERCRRRRHSPRATLRARIFRQRYSTLHDTTHTHPLGARRSTTSPVLTRIGFQCSRSTRVESIRDSNDLFVRSPYPSINSNPNRVYVFDLTSPAHTYTHSLTARQNRSH